MEYIHVDLDVERIERMGRPRTRHRDLPPNLYKRQDSATYRWRHPRTGKFHPIGSDRATAIEAAKRLNALTAQPQPSDTAILSGTGGTPYQRAIEHFRRVEIPQRKLKPKTQYNYERMLTQIGDKLGKRDCHALTVGDFATFLRTATNGDRRRQQLRGLLVDIGRAACAEGWMDTNLAAHTQARKPKRQRARLTADDFAAIRQHAPAWLQAAMDLDRYILLRESDLVALRFPRAEDTELTVELGKSERWDSGEHVAQTVVAIPIDPRLAQLIAACRDRVACPYVVHTRLARAKGRAEWPAWRDHPHQIDGPYLSRAFATARAKAVKHEGLSWAGAPPPWHEIRSLGAAEHRAAGMPEQHIQTLLGHADIATTRIYLAGHQPPVQRVAWTARDEP